ncbi:hypothetical protein RXV95_05200 [Novosphingobium sp. ZN18A2]|uniref:hypothetical protein n=1 Tax=Novosphingobium sp. ZN18A2 TaxID=3079861 RepID=UPI0030D2C696
MYTTGFFSTTLGRAALASILAMVAMNCVALSSQLRAEPAAFASGTTGVTISGELA